MAKLSDVRPVLKSVGFFAFVKRILKQIREDSVPTWASAMAYSWLFAIFPFLIFMLSLLPLIPERFKADAEPRIYSAVTESIPSQDAAKIINDQIHSVFHPQTKTVTRSFLSVGLLLTIWGASRGVAMTMSALDIAYDIEKFRPFWKQSLVAIGLTLVNSVLVLLVMVLMPIGTGVISWLVNHAAHWIGSWSWLLIFVNVARYAIALLLLFAITATIYFFGPNFKQKFHFITPGALFTIGVWLILGLAFRIYITKFGGAASYSKTYGAVAGLVILLLFFYIDSLVLLVGAEINSEIDFAIKDMEGKPHNSEGSAKSATQPEKSLNG